MGSDHAIAFEALPPRLAGLLAFWKGKAGTRPFPSRADIDVFELKPWLGALHLVERLTDGDLRYRIFATESAKRIGRDFTGQKFSEFTAGNSLARAALAQYRAVLDAGLPAAEFFPSRTLNERHLAYWRLILPLGEDGAASQLLVGIQYTSGH